MYKLSSHHNYCLETRCVILINLFPDQSTKTASDMLKGVVGLVTGGASGLGRATVERIVREGGKVTGPEHRCW